MSHISVFLSLKRQVNWVKFGLAGATSLNIGLTNTCLAEEPLRWNKIFLLQFLLVVKLCEPQSCSTNLNLTEGRSSAAFETEMSDGKNTCWALTSSAELSWTELKASCVSNKKYIHLSPCWLAFVVLSGLYITLFKNKINPVVWFYFWLLKLSILKLSFTYFHANIQLLSLGQMLD